MDWIQDLTETERTRADIDGLSDLDFSEMATLSAVRRAITLRREVETFETRWPEAAGDSPCAPVFTWNQLERQLSDLAGDPVKALMARDLVSATRKMSKFKPPEMVLREILCLSWALLDEGFRPEPGSDWGMDSPGAQ
jgi:hypothetical protein